MLWDQMLQDHMLQNHTLRSNMLRDHMLQEHYLGRVGPQLGVSQRKGLDISEQSCVGPNLHSGICEMLQHLLPRLHRHMHCSVCDLTVTEQHVPCGMIPDRQWHIMLHVRVRCLLALSRKYVIHGTHGTVWGSHGTVGGTPGTL